MKLHPRVSRSLVELVKRFEGLRRRAARLPDGGWTVGYGHTRSAREGAVVSPEDAEALLYYDLSDVAQKVDAWTFTPLNQNQFEALTAFAFNIGPENFRRSTVLSRVNEGQHLQAAAALELWRKADFGGEDLVIDALVRRRAAEKAHYLTPPEGFRPSPTPVLRPTFDHSVIEAAALARAGRPAVVVDAPLDGEDAAVHLEPSAPGDADAAFPAAVALVADGRGVHRLFPEKTDVAPPADPFAEREEPSVDQGAEIPPPPPPLAALESPAPAARGVGPTPVATPASPQAGVHYLHSNEGVGFAPQASARSESRIDGHPNPLFERSVVYLCTGLLGVALFLAALFSMLGGRATAVNLIIGLIGILFLTPAGGYFLLKHLDKGQVGRDL